MQKSLYAMHPMYPQQINAGEESSSGVDYANIVLRLCLS
jgi:hypothetical protein